jgi:hypothetical protein
VDLCVRPDGAAACGACLKRQAAQRWQTGEPLICDIDHRVNRGAVPSCSTKQEGDPMYVINAVLVIAILFIFFLPITDYKTVRMKLCVLCALALVLTASVTRTQVPDPRVASLVR